jgi:4-hydroxy-4-methyl-2-oxoglutarate aldolase
MSDDHKPICARLGALPTAILGDTLREMGFHHQALHHSIAGLDRGMRCSGPAFCIAGEASMSGTPNSASGAPNPGFEMFRRPLDGRVLVIATGGYDEAPVWGENIALSARIARVGGVVVDGGLRDVLAQIELGIPTWARFTTPVSSAKRWRITRIDEPIVMRGQTHGQVAVEPGDPIVADADGVIVVPSRVAETVAEAAEELDRIEQRQREEILRGDDRQAVYERYDRFGHIPKLG